MTFTVTLSRVMVSCRSADTVRVRMSIVHRTLDAERNDPVQTRPAQHRVATEAKYDAALIFLRNAQAAEHMGARARALEDHPHVAEVRQRGMIVAIELTADKATRAPYPWQERRGLAIYRHALTRGVLLRPIGNVVYFMPPYVITRAEIDLIVEVALEGIERATCD